MPDYSIYRLHELETALKNLDETAHPEEAKLIREYIAKGGYIYSGDIAVKAVHFTSRIYKSSLVGILSLLLALNLLSFAALHNSLSLIAIVFQGALLFMIYRNHRRTRAMVRIWAGMAAISGVLMLLSMALAGEMTPNGMVSVALGLIGLPFLLLSNKCIQLIPEHP